MKKVRAIQFRMLLDGQGIVNYDSKEQKWAHIHNETGLEGDYNGRNENVNFAKKNFYKTGVRTAAGKEVLDTRIKISSDCLKKNLFNEDIIATSPNLMHHDSILYNYLASPVALLRGWMFTEKNSLKRKSALVIVDAEQVNGAMPYIEVFAKAETKLSKQEHDDKSSATYYHTESVGKMKYRTDGDIDIAQLQLVSVDETLDRFAFNPDNFDLFKKFFETYFGSADIKLAYNKLKSSVIDLDEYSIMLKDEYIKEIVKGFLIKALKFKIRKRNSFALCELLEVRLVTDPTVQTSSNEDGWLPIKTVNDIQSLLEDIEFYKFYEEVDQALSCEKRNIIEEDKKKKAEEKKEDKKKKAEEKKDVKKKSKEDDITA